MGWFFRKKRALPEGFRESLAPDRQFAEKAKREFLFFYDAHQPSNKRAGAEFLIREDGYGTIDRMTLDEFKNADLRVGEITAAEPVEGSEKLLRLQVDIGEETARQIVSGIAKAYAPGDLVGKKVVIIANLEPRTLMGHESRGMLLAARGEDESPVLLLPEGEVPRGSKIS